MLKKITLKIKTVFIPCLENNFRPGFLEGKFLISYFLVVFLLKAILIIYLFFLPKTIFFADISKTVLIELNNKERKLFGLSPLRENVLLSKAAYLKAQDMINKDYFSHQSPDGKSPWYWIKSVGYNYQHAGENLAIGFLEAEEVYQAWKSSSSHNYNLFNPRYQEVGIAVLKGDFQGNEAFVVVQLFGSSQNKPAVKEAVLEESKVKEKTIENQSKIIKEEIIENEKVSGPLEEKNVLSEESPFLIADLPESEKVKSSPFFNFLTFLSLDYDDFLEGFILYSFFLITILLVMNIVIRFDVQHRDIVLRSTLFTIFLALFFLIGKEEITKIISRDLIF